MQASKQAALGKLRSAPSFSPLLRHQRCTATHRDRSVGMRSLCAPLGCGWYAVVPLAFIRRKGKEQWSIAMHRFASLLQRDSKCRSREEAGAAIGVQLPLRRSWLTRYLGLDTALTLSPSLCSPDPAATRSLTQLHSILQLIALR